MTGFFCKKILLKEIITINTRAPVGIVLGSKLGIDDSLLLQTLFGSTLSAVDGTDNRMLLSTTLKLGIDVGSLLGLLIDSKFSMVLENILGYKDGTSDGASGGTLLALIDGELYLNDDPNCKYE